MNKKMRNRNTGKCSKDPVSQRSLTAQQLRTLIRIDFCHDSRYCWVGCAPGWRGWSVWPGGPTSRPRSPRPRCLRPPLRGSSWVGRGWDGCCPPPPRHLVKN